MQEALHLLQPPGRHGLIEDVIKHSDDMNNRLVASSKVEIQLTAARRIFHAVSNWYEPIRVKNTLRKSLAAAAKRRDYENIRTKQHEDDERF